MLSSTSQTSTAVSGSDQHQSSHGGSQRGVDASTSKYDASAQQDGAHTLPADAHKVMASNNNNNNMSKPLEIIDTEATSIVDMGAYVSNHILEVQTAAAESHIDMKTYEEGKNFPKNERQDVCILDIILHELMSAFESEQTIERISILNDLSISKIIKAANHLEELGIVSITNKNPIQKTSILTLKNPPQ
eukprot:12409119-Karenia_brevis.AAC.1